MTYYFKWFVDWHYDQEIFNSIEDAIKDRQNYLDNHGGFDRIIGIIWIPDKSREVNPITFR